MSSVFGITLIFHWYIRLIHSIISVDVNQVAMVDDVETFPNTVAAIAATNTVYYVCNTLLFLPLVTPMVRLLDYEFFSTSNQDI
ncbi:hypothetical protein [Stieleria maiorica]|uniref:hypothetical protein n=1 Tax=Stieleria maiorica TaxID=2795974 RepID=UPI001F3C1A52|nr:hypothetical protein [Stieleria maiorica]